MKFVTFFALCFGFCSTVRSHLNFSGPECKYVVCKPTEYCDAFSNKCSPCAQICDEESPNFTGDRCQENCQNFIHDQRYLRSDTAVVRNLQFTVNVLLALVCIFIVIIVALVVLSVWKWKRDNNVTLKTLKEKIFWKKSNNNTGGPQGNGVAMNDQVGGNHDLRLDIPTPTHRSQSENSPVTQTTAVSRMPEEDSIDYAYDNPAMTNNSNSSSRLGHVTA